MTAFKQVVFFSFSFVLFIFILFALFYPQTPKSDVGSANMCLRVYNSESAPCFLNADQILKLSYFENISKDFKIVGKKPYCDDELFDSEGKWEILDVSIFFCVRHF